MPAEELAHRGLGERIEPHRDRAAPIRAPARSAFEQLRAGEGDHEDRVAPAPVEEVLDEVEQAVVGPLEVLEDEGDRARRGDPLEERPPGREELLAAARRCVLDTEQGQQAGLDPAPFLGVGDVPDEDLGDAGPGRRVVVALGQPGPPADHLAEGPEGDALAVATAIGRGATRRSRRRRRGTSRAPRRAGSCRSPPDPRGTRGGPALAARDVELLLEEAQLVIPADERRLEHVGPVERRPGRRRPAAPGTPGPG